MLEQEELAVSPGRKQKSSRRPSVVLPRLCVSFSRFSGSRISAKTTFSPDEVHRLE